MGKIEVALGDITKQRVDAIVNAANTTLRGGGGVDGAIHRAAGPGLDLACARFGGCLTGEARLTPGFRLPARFVIHTPGPVWQGGHHGEAQLLAACYQNSLALAAKAGCRTVAFPSISTGVYAYPLPAAAAVAIAALRTGLTKWPGIELVRMVCFDPVTAAAYRTALSGNNEH